MLAEKDCSPEERFLPILCLVPIKILPTKKLIKQFTKGRELSVSDQYVIDNYLQWRQGPNEIVAYTSYGYCDTNVPKEFNYLLDLENRQGGIDVKATVKFAIWNGHLPLNTIEHGHKTICIISFEGGIPTELKSLPTWDQQWTSMRFGLCDMNDKQLILARISTKADGQ